VFKIKSLSLVNTCYEVVSEIQFFDFSSCTSLHIAIQAMSATTHIRPPSTTSSTLPRASHRPLPSSSSSINISSFHPQLASSDTTSVSRQKEEFKIPTARSTTAGGARKVSGKQLGAVSNSSRTTESGNIGSARGPKRVLQGLQESTSEPRGLRDSSKSTGGAFFFPALVALSS